MTIDLVKIHITLRFQLYVFELENGWVMEHLAGFDRKEAFNLDTEFQRVGLSLKPLPPHSPHPSLIRRMGR